MRVAAIQAESVWLDMEKGVDKVCTLIAEAAAQNCDLVGFPVSPLNATEMLKLIVPGGLCSRFLSYAFHHAPRSYLDVEIPEKLDRCWFSVL